MRERDLLRWSRFGLTITALVVVLALVLGARPYTLARETGLTLTGAEVCSVCNGAPTAATVAPTVDTVHAAAPLAGMAALPVPWLVEITTTAATAQTQIAPLLQPPRA